MLKKHSFWKSLVIFIGTLAILAFLAFKNLENRLVYFYRHYHFEGEIHVTGLEIDFEKFKSARNEIVRVHYTYSGKIDGTRQEIPIQINLDWASLLVPAYEKEVSFDDELLDLASPVLDDKTGEMLSPIYHKTMDLTSSRKKFEDDYNQMMKKYPIFKNSRLTIQPKKNPWSDTLMRSLVKNERQGKAGADNLYGWTIKEGLENQLYYFQIEGLEEEDPSLIKKSLSQLLKDFDIKYSFFKIDDSNSFLEVY